MADLQAQIALARKAGYSDTDIVSHLAQTDPRFATAKQHGYQDSEVLNYLVTAGSQAKAQSQAEQARGPNDFSGQAARSFSLGLTDPFNAGVGAVLSQAPRLIGKDPGFGLSDAFNAARGVEKERANQYDAAHPIISKVAALLGGLGSPVNKIVTPGGGLIANMAKGAVAGAVQGGVSGAATADPGQVVQSGMHGAEIGGALGAALPVAGSVASKTLGIAKGLAKTTVRAANRATGGALLDANQTAADRLGEAMMKDGMSPQAIQAAQTEWNRVGGPSPAFVDLVTQNGGGQATLSLLRGAAMAPGAARNIATQRATQVASDLQDNAIARTTALTADTRPVSQVKDGLTAQRRAQAAVDYPKFENYQLPVGSDLISATDGPTGLKFMQNAANLASAERNTPRAQEIAALSGENPASSISAGGLDYIRRGLRDAASEAARSGNNQLARALGQRADDLETALMDAPGFDAARTNYHNTSQQIDGLDLGQTGLNAKPDAFSSELAANPQAAGTTVPIGYRQALTDKIGSPTEGATGALNTIATNTNQGKNLAAAFGQDQADAYRQSLSNMTHQLNIARKIDPNTGSATAVRGADSEAPGLSFTKGIGGLISSAVAKIQAGATMTDAERAAILKLGLGNVGDILSKIKPQPVAGPAISPLLAAPLVAATGPYN
jgi:hypothetical protein